MSGWELLGFTGAGLFFSRFLVQWWVSERAGESVVPRSFWWLSISGSLLLGTYTVHVGEPILLAGHLINGLIYARNLSFQYARGRPRVLGMLAVTILALFAGIVLLVLTIGASRLSEPAASTAWFVCALAGQVIWSTRFVVQWWCSERHGRSYLPRSFWWISLVGNALLLAYSLYLADAVLVFSYLSGPVVQVRNLILGSRGCERPDGAQAELR